MRLSIPGPEGALEAELWVPEGDVRVAAAMCHPHPLHGGSMSTTAVYRAGRGLQQAGVAVLRFNFRGVGASEGSHHGMGGPGSEEDDLVAALDHLEEAFPGLDLWGGGFSFGSRTALGLVSREDRIDRLVLVAPPVLSYDLPVLGALPVRGLCVMASDDEFGSRAALLEQYPAAAEQLDLVEFQGADHFFRGHTRELQATVRDWALAELARP